MKRFGDLLHARRQIAIAFTARRSNKGGMAATDPEDDRAGLALLVEALRAELLRFLTARCGDSAEAEDLLQELWLKATTVPSRPIANGRAYLFRIANNLVLDQARKRRRAMRRDRAWLDSEAAPDVVGQRRQPDAEAALMDAEEAELLRRAVEALPERARRALLLYRYDGCGQTEIARIMGISLSGVEKHLASAMKQLRRTLKDCGFFGAAASQEHETAKDGAQTGNPTS
jgi:RNA polymerase sigma-70 factor (ECF subfamily)